MTRYDKKFIFHESYIPTILENSQENYFIIESGENRIFNYHSSYFDTPDYSMYMNHHNGKMNRYKIRIRKYIDSGDRFVEIKHKNSQSLTSKKRILYNHDLPFSPEAGKFIEKHAKVNPNDLIISLITRYKRITLLNKFKDERITIDFKICIADNCKEMQLSNLAIAEVKNSERHYRTHFISILNELNIKQESISKYCIGLALINNQVKSNAFKEKIQKINKINNEPGININKPVFNYEPVI